MRDSQNQLRAGEALNKRLLSAKKSIIIKVKELENLDKITMYKTFGSSTLLDEKLIFKKAEVGPYQKVADLGCGKTGYFIFPLSHIVGSDGIVYAVDILKTILETINRQIKLENIKNIKTVWSNLEIFNATKIETNSLDVGLLINTLYQSRKRAAILRESIRMIKSQGRLVVVDWNNSSLSVGPSARERVQPELLKKAAQKLGLSLEDEFIPGQYHYGLVFTKY